MTEREFKRLKSQIEKDYHERLRALQIVYDMSKKMNAEGAEDDEATGRGPLTAAVRAVLPEMEGDFTLQDVEGLLRRLQPAAATGLKSASLSSVLTRLADKEELKVITPGKGRTPTVYRKETPDAAPARVVESATGPEDETT